MTIGAMAIGTITDYLGRRKVMIIAAFIFSIFTLACAFATSLVMFGTFRFLAGLGLGGCLPTAITLVTEYARKGKSSSAATTIMTGYHVGAVLTALLAIVVMSQAGLSWRWMFVIGGVTGLILAPLMIKNLPESEVFLEQRAAGKVAGSSTAAAANPIGALFAGGLARATLAFWGASFCGLILVLSLIHI